MCKKHLLLIILPLLLLLVGCKDDIETIQFSTVTQDGNEITLKWTPTSMSGFKYYRIMRATDGVRFSTINNVDSAGTDAFKRDVTTFTDTSFPYADSVIYKIMVFGDEIISSPNFSIKIKKPIIINQSIQNAYILQGENKILVLGYNGSDSYMYLYDYSTNTLINKVPINMSSSSSTVFFGKYNGRDEFYFYDSWNSRIYIYDALTLTQIASINYSGSYPMFSTNNNGTIYANSGSSYTSIIDRKSLTMKSYQGTNYINQLYYMNVNNKLLGTYYSNIVLYTMDDMGNIATETQKSVSYASNSIYIANSTLVYRGDYSLKKILNTDNWLEYPLVLPNNVVKEFTTLYSANNVLYACSNNEPKLYCFSMTDFKLIKTIDIKFTPYKFLSDSEYLFYYGYSNGINIVEKMKLVQ